MTKNTPEYWQHKEALADIVDLINEIFPYKGEEDQHKHLPKHAIEGVKHLIKQLKGVKRDEFAVHMQWSRYTKLNACEKALTEIYELGSNGDPLDAYTVAMIAKTALDNNTVAEQWTETTKSKVMEK